MSSRGRTLRWTSLTLLGSALAACPALAQDAQPQNDGGRPLQPVEEGGEAPPVRDLGGWLGEDDEPQAGQPQAGPQGGGDPLAPESDVVPPGAQPQPQQEQEQELSPAEKRKRERTINRNYDKALDTYKDLGKPTRDLDVLDRRINNNERIVKQYSGRLGDARDQRRTLQVQLYNRMFYLRQQHERGQIDDDTFNRLSREAERTYSERADGLKGDLNAWRDEVHHAQGRLDSLKSERRMLQASIPRTRRMRGKGSAGNQPPPAGMRLLNSLESKLRQLDQFGTRQTMDGVDPRSVGASSVGLRRAKPAPEPEEKKDEDEGGGWFDWF